MYSRHQELDKLIMLEVNELKGIVTLNGDYLLPYQKPECLTKSLNSTDILFEHI
jgi:hypothetical protein